MPVRVWFGSDAGSIHEPVTVLGLAFTLERKLYAGFLALAVLVAYLITVDPPCNLYLSVQYIALWLRIKRYFAAWPFRY